MAHRVAVHGGVPRFVTICPVRTAAKMNRDRTWPSRCHPVCQRHPECAFSTAASIPAWSKPFANAYKAPASTAAFTCIFWNTAMPSFDRSNDQWKQKKEGKSELDRNRARLPAPGLAFGSGLGEDHGLLRKLDETATAGRRGAPHRTGIPYRREWRCFGRRSFLR